MNYIHKLQAEKAELEARLSRINKDLTDLAAYLGSQKFNCGNEMDRYVNIQDVLDRIADARFDSIV